jgi:hypothetical protein
LGMTDPRSGFASSCCTRISASSMILDLRRTFSSSEIV